MRFEITHRLDEDQFAAVLVALEKIGRIGNAVLSMKDDYNRRMDEMALNFEALVAEVEENSSVVGSASTTLTTLAQEIRDLKDQITDPTAQAKLDELAARIDANNAALAAAIAANTEAAVPPTE